MSSKSKIFLLVDPEKHDLNEQEGAGEGGDVDRQVVQLHVEDRQLCAGPLPTHLHPLQRDLLDALFQGGPPLCANNLMSNIPLLQAAKMFTTFIMFTILQYNTNVLPIQAAKMFTWENHGVAGNLER